MVVIPLIGSDLVARVDDCDAHLAAYKWYPCPKPRGMYARRNTYVGKKHSTVSLHREVLGVPPGVQVDHKDGDGLNCQRHNLRSATHGQNMANRRATLGSKSKYKGVYRRPNGRWQASIRVNHVAFCLGTFSSEEEAARAYDLEAVLRFGEFARLNCPGEGK